MNLPGRFSDMLVGWLFDLLEDIRDPYLTNYLNGEAYREIQPSNWEPGETKIRIFAGASQRSRPALPGKPDYDLMDLKGPYQPEYVGSPLASGHNVIYGVHTQFRLAHRRKKSEKLEMAV